MSEKTALLEAAYDEYCRVQESSTDVDVEQFLSRYSTIRSSLRRQICVHDFLVHRSHIVDLCRDVRWPVSGESVCDFTVLEELGRGAFARVYLCRQAGIGGRLVVVKFAAGGAYEADMLGRLSHPNIMPIHSVGHDALTGLSAVCMPWRGRSTLCDLIDRTFSQPMTPPRGDTILRVAREDTGPGEQVDDCGPADPFLKRCSYEDGVIHLGIQLADAIAHAHERGVRHGDLKPSNVLLSAAGRPLLLDFNLAVRESAGVSAPGGTMPYMSPEQLAAFQGAEGSGLDPDGLDIDAAQFDAQSDVFSLGVILFELLTGKLPFGEVAVGASASERARTLAVAQAKGPQSLRAFNPRVDRRLAQLIESCLAVDKCERPTDAAALAGQLRRRLSPVSRGGRWMGRHKVLVASIVMAVVVSAGTASAFFALREPQSMRQYRQALADFNGGRMDEAIARLNPVIAASPDDADALLLRGLARMRSKEYSLAITDLEAARKRKHDPRILAAQAYCMCRSQYFREARLRYTEAMAAGYDQPDARNNLAYCYLSQKKFPKAEEQLDLAAKAYPQCAQVFYNRATMGLDRMSTNDYSRWEEAVEDCKQLLKMSAPNSHIELLAAAIYSTASRGDARLVDASLRHFENACRLGLQGDKDAIAQSRSLAALHTHPRFVTALALIPAGIPAGTVHSLPDPLVEPSLAMSGPR